MSTQGLLAETDRQSLSAIYEDIIANAHYEDGEGWSLEKYQYWVEKVLLDRIAERTEDNQNICAHVISPSTHVEEVDQDAMEPDSLDVDGASSTVPVMDVDVKKSPALAPAPAPAPVTEEPAAKAETSPARPTTNRSVGGLLSQEVVEVCI